MDVPARCEECEAIREQLRAALEEMPPEVRKEYEADRDAFMKVVGGSDEDLERLEQAGERFRFPFQPRGSHEKHRSHRWPEDRYPEIQSAFRRMIVHRFQSGHRSMFAEMFNR